MKLAQPFPLGLQRYLSGPGSALLANALVSHPAGAGGTVQVVMTRDPKYFAHFDLPSGEPLEAHHVVGFADGTILDAGGRRGFEQFCRDFTFDPAYTWLEQRPADAPWPLLHDLLDAFTWSGHSVPCNASPRIAEGTLDEAFDSLDQILGLFGLCDDTMGLPHNRELVIGFFLLAQDHTPPGARLH